MDHNFLDKIIFTTILVKKEQEVIDYVSSNSKRSHVFCGARFRLF